MARYFFPQDFSPHISAFSNSSYLCRFVGGYQVWCTVWFAHGGAIGEYQDPITVRFPAGDTVGRCQVWYEVWFMAADDVGGRQENVGPEQTGGRS